MEDLLQAVYFSSEIVAKKPHFHDCHQIILILKGEAQFFVNGNCFNATAGDVAVFSRYENHSVKVQSREYERYVLQLDSGVINRKSSVYSLLTDRPAGFSNVISIGQGLPELTRIFEQLISETESGLAMADEMVQLLIKQLLIKISRSSEIAYDTENDSVILDIKRKFENSFQEKHTLNALAKEYSLSVSSLSHRFKKQTGLSVMDYLISCRIAAAKRLLATTSKGIGEIVEECGFSDSSNFSRCFKRLHGMSPTKFRKIYNVIA